MIKPQLDRGSHPPGRRIARLRQLGLPEALATRAQELPTALGATTADRYLEFFEALLSTSSLPPFATVEIAACLDTHEQRQLTSEVIKRAIPSVEAFADLETLSALLFRISKLEYSDAAVTEFVHAGMQHTLRERTGSFQSREKHFNYHDARDALLGCKRIFDAAGSRFFLDRGTLLGAVREGGFIASDYDIDVGIFADEITLEEVKALFAGTEFTLTQDFEFKVGVASPTGIQIDFFLTARERGYFLSKGYRSIHNWYFTPFELMEFSFLGEQFLIPATYEKHLDENYGNWRDPAIFYDLSYNEPCVAYGSGPEARSYLSKRLGRALRKGWRYYSVAAANGLANAFDVDVRDRLPHPVAATVAPDEPTAHRARPVVVIARFALYQAHHRRVIESALSLTPDVRIHFVADNDDERAENVAVSGAIARVTETHPAAFESDGASLDLAALLKTNPRALAVDRSLAGLIPSTHMVSLVDSGCDVAFFDDSTVALNLVDGRVVARSTPEQPHSRR